jgi:hypothetical protein
MSFEKCTAILKIVTQLVEKSEVTVKEVKTGGNMGNYVRVRVRYDVTQVIQGFVHSYNKDEK